MNERIKELIALATTYETGPPNWTMTANTEIKIFNQEKFAESIVQRCAELSDIAEKHCLHPGTIIKRHFGVEE